MSFIAHNFPESVALAAAFAVLFVDAFARKVAHFGEAGTIWLLPSGGGLYRGLSGVFGEKAASGVERGVAAKGGRSGGQGEGEDGKEIEVIDKVHCSSKKQIFLGYNSMKASGLVHWDKARN